MAYLQLVENPFHVVSTPFLLGSLFASKEEDETKLTPLSLSLFQPSFERVVNVPNRGFGSRVNRHRFL